MNVKRSVLNNRPIHYALTLLMYIGFVLISINAFQPTFTLIGWVGIACLFVGVIYRYSVASENIKKSSFKLWLIIVVLLSVHIFLLYKIYPELWDILGIGR